MTIPRCADPDCRTRKSAIWHEIDRALFCDKCYKNVNTIYLPNSPKED